MRSLISLLLLLLCLEGVFSLVHDHEDGKKHSECVLCVIKNQKQVDDSLRIEIGYIDLVLSHISEPEKTGVPSEGDLKQVSARGPPS